MELGCCSENTKLPAGTEQNGRLRPSVACRFGAGATVRRAESRPAVSSGQGRGRGRAPRAGHRAVAREGASPGITPEERVLRPMVRRRALWSCCFELFSKPSVACGWPAKQQRLRGRSCRARQPRTEQPPGRIRSRSPVMDEEEEESPQER